MEVIGPIAFVNDLHSEKAVYHQACSANFHTGKGIPQLYDDDDDDDDGPKSNQVQKEANLLTYFENLLSCLLKFPRKRMVM